MLITTTAAFLLIICFYIYQKKKLNTRLPGPWPLPVVGSLHLLDPKAPYLSLTKLAQKYGPIFSLKLGVLNAVVISDPKLIKKVLMKDEALGRPPLYVLDHVCRGKGILLAEGYLWKEQRKFIINALRSLGAAKVSNQRQWLETQIKVFAKKCVQDVKLKGDRPRINTSDLITYYVTNVITLLLFGKTFSRDDDIYKKLVHYIDQGAKTVGVAGPLNFFPYLRFIPYFRKTVYTLDEVYINLHQIQTDAIEAIQNNNNSSLNIIQAFLAQNKKSEDVYTMEQLRFLLVDLFGAGVETSVTTMVWVMLYLAQYQNVQNKLRKELSDVLQGRELQLEDLPNLPYMEATLAEVARAASIIPLGFPHYALKDILVEDYIIKKGTMIMPLLWAVHKSPTLWDEPEKFYPERFLNEEGKFQQSEYLLPFQIGKRVCVGEELAKIMIFLFYGTILREFKIEVFDSEPLDFTGFCGITLMPKPQDLIFVKI